MSNLLLILGNGFSIDFISNIKKVDTIDVRNLFRLGHTVKFPGTNIPGFLSYKHCPNLWLLGSRPNIEFDECMSIIEEIITCSNMLFDYLSYMGSDKNRMKFLEKENKSIYIQAYSELIAYLRHLFIDYDSKISNDDIKSFVEETDWGWVSFFKKAKIKYENVKIVTYNYDIWLERILNALNIDYSIGGCEPDDKHFNVIKPHGSISFVPKSGKKSMYEINYTIDSGDTDIDKLGVMHTDLEQYDKNLLIPPAGDSSRQQTNVWSKKLRSCAIEAAKKITESDDAIICGMSYWHVDRKELDELLINLNQDVNITLINPEPPKDLNAVLVTLFKNYKAFTSSASLGGLII